ncbi:hypothetical protein [Fontivita pretiosa]|uniref:hypothetical protein n=1 Tax=Fontivita pretiosa TaxID=2989684 RepID=UPI003D1685BB
MNKPKPKMEIRIGAFRLQLRQDPEPGDDIIAVDLEDRIAWCHPQLWLSLSALEAALAPLQPSEPPAAKVLARACWRGCGGKVINSRTFLSVQNVLSRIVGTRQPAPVRNIQPQVHQWQV